MNETIFINVVCGSLKLPLEISLILEPVVELCNDSERGIEYKVCSNLLLIRDSSTMMSASGRKMSALLRLILLEIGLE